MVAASPLGEQECRPLASKGSWRQQPLWSTLTSRKAIALSPSNTHVIKSRQSTRRRLSTTHSQTTRCPVYSLLCALAVSTSARQHNIILRMYRQILQCRTRPQRVTRDAPWMPRMVEKEPQYSSLQHRGSAKIKLTCIQQTEDEGKQRKDFIAQTSDTCMEGTPILRSLPHTAGRHSISDGNHTKKWSPCEPKSLKHSWVIDRVENVAHHGRRFFGGSPNSPLRATKMVL